MNAPEVCHFQPGQLVECIDDEWVDEHGQRRDGAMPLSGCIYTVSDLKDYFGVIFMRLDTFTADIWFSSLHFRPVQTPSIDCFHSLLAPSPASTREVEPA